MSVTINRDTWLGQIIAEKLQMQYDNIEAFDFETTETDSVLNYCIVHSKNPPKKPVVTDEIEAEKKEDEMIAPMVFYESIKETCVTCKGRGMVIDRDARKGFEKRCENCKGRGFYLVPKMVLSEQQRQDLAAIAKLEKLDRAGRLILQVKKRLD